MTMAQYDIRPVREDATSRIILPPKPLSPTSIIGAAATHDASRWVSYRHSERDDPRRVSAYYEGGRATKGPRRLLGGSLFDAMGTAGVVAMPHVPGRRPTTARDHPDYTEDAAPRPLRREETHVGMQDAFFRVPGPRRTERPTMLKPEDRPDTGSGEINLSPDRSARRAPWSANSSSPSWAITEAATGGMSEPAHAALPLDHDSRWLSFSAAHRPEGAPPVHAFSYRGTITRGPRTMIGARQEHLERLHGISILHHPVGRRPRAFDRHPTYTEARARPQPLSKTSAALGLLTAFNAVPAAYNGSDADGDNDGTPATGAPVVEAARSRSAYTAPVVRENDTALRLVALALGSVPIAAPEPGQDTTVPRTSFPETRQNVIAARIQEQIIAWQPAFLVAAVASCTDVLALEAAQGLGIKIGIVLPAPQAVVRARLTAERGEAWAGRLNLLLAHAAAGVRAEASLQAAHQRVLDEALALARANTGAGQVPAHFMRALVVSDASAADAVSVTGGSSFGMEAQKRGVRLTTISPDDAPPISGAIRETAGRVVGRVTRPYGRDRMPTGG